MNEDIQKMLRMAELIRDAVPWTDTNTTYDLSPYAKTADVNAALAKKVDVVSGKGLSTRR